ncbi:62363eee-ebac-4559-95b9-02bf3d28c070 [Sclerotinia trifoliorum]|uniref:62363eee-ebac-4559-95b9-02bf3d28c070 n=1 Tax=Sclerotinia trifoliorum TaxID=28548 RepID=A0A8H2VTT2_9HELO|nr:62363eee-ebac-4559-95b9-02bf3d28c070 [Sclerotinia trifoliorum]
MLVDWYLFLLPIPACLSFANVYCKEDWCVDHLYDRRAAIASMINLYYRVKLQSDPSDATWKVGYVLLWTNIETFAGVAASSMPTVHQFFSGWSFSLASWKASLKSSLIHLPGRNKREKLSGDHQPGFTAWPGDDVGNSGGHKGIRMNELDLTAYDRVEPENPRVADPESQIRLTHFILSPESKCASAMADCTSGKCQPYRT